MITIKDIEKLASLSRISLKEDEKESFTSEIDAILGYIDQIKQATSSTSDDLKNNSDLLVKNILREDEPRDVDASIGASSGKHTENLLHASPDRDGQYIKVKKIL